MNASLVGMQTLHVTVMLFGIITGIFPSAVSGAYEYIMAGTSH